MQTKTLFSQHYLTHRLPQHPEWAEDPLPVLENLLPLWHKAQEFGDTWSEAQTEDEFIKPVLAVLGWTFTVQPKSKQAGHVTRPDYALFADVATQQDAYPSQGDDDAFYSRVLAIAEAKYWGRPLSRQDSSGRETWKRGENPSHQMVSYLVGTRVPWGILTNGRMWRLYSREVSSTASEFYEIDLGAVLGEIANQESGRKNQESRVKNYDSRDPKGWRAKGGDAETLDAFRRFWLFFRRDAFVPDAQGRNFVQRVHEGSATYAREISDKLKELVYAEVMPEIAGGFLAYRREQRGILEESETSLDAIYQASLSLLYKLLFLLYAEARGLLPVENPGYREQSLTALAQWAADRRDRNLPLSTATHATPKYDALLALFHRIDQGDPSLGIPRYNGGLFNPQNPDNAFLEQHRLSDRAVADTVDILVRDAGQPVDYAYISVRNLGAIYEGLLENKLRVEHQESTVRQDKVASPAPDVIHLVNDKGERKATGSYYTPDYIVEYIVAQTLEPLLAARAETFAAAMTRVAELRRALGRTANTGKVRLLRGQLDTAARDAREAFLGLKVLDPAMGSGHFLVNAVDFLTDGIIERMQTFHDAHPDIPWDWNPIQQLVERVRAEILDEMACQDIAVDPARLDDTALLTRVVMKRCIYGVDLNPMAVELAKLSLWLHSFTVGAPLSFLDHHLRWGNSLIGTDVRTVEAGIQMTDTGQFGLFAGPFAGLLDLTALMVEVVDRADATLSDVQRSAEDFATLQAALTPYKQVLDLWVSRHFGNPEADEFLRLYGGDVLPALRGDKEVAARYQAVIARARDLWADKRFFHWDLEFPEVFVDLRRRDWAENPGFDAVIGNPPYVPNEQMPKEERDYFPLCYSVSSGKYDLSVVFMQRSSSLMTEPAYLGMIVPLIWQTGDNYVVFRKKNFIDGLFGPKILINLPFNVFPDAYVDTGIVIFSKPKSTSFEVFAYSKKAHIDRIELSLDDLRTILLTQVKNDSQNRIFTNPERYIFAAKFSSQFCITVGDISDACQGPVESFYEYSDVKLDESYLPYYTCNVYRYDLTVEKHEYIKFGTNNPLWKYYTQPRVLIRRIVSRSNRLMAILAKEPFVVKKDLNPFVIEESNYHIGFLLCVFNSMLHSYLYIEASTAAGKDDFRQTTLSGLRALPIPRIDFTTPAEERARLLAGARDLAAAWVQQADAATASYAAFLASPLNAHLTGPASEGAARFTLHAPDVVHDLLAALAEDMIALNREKQAEVEGFLAWLERHIGADLDTLSGKTILRGYLGDYQKDEAHLSFEEMLARLRRNRRKLSADPDARAFQETLAREYDASLVTLRPLKRRLAATDRLIDLLVYRLYGLTEEEVAIVEGK